MRSSFICFFFQIYPEKYFLKDADDFEEISTRILSPHTFKRCCVSSAPIRSGSLQISFNIENRFHLIESDEKLAGKMWMQAGKQFKNKCSRLVILTASKNDFL